MPMLCKFMWRGDQSRRLRCQHFRTIRVSKEFLAGGMNAAFSSDGQSSLKQSFSLFITDAALMTLPILPARALRPMDRPMHLWQSVHMIDHHHCLHMEGEELGAVAATEELDVVAHVVCWSWRRAHPRVYYHVHLLHAAVEGWRYIISYDWQ